MAAMSGIALRRSALRVKWTLSQLVYAALYREHLATSFDMTQVVEFIVEGREGRLVVNSSSRAKWADEYERAVKVDAILKSGFATLATFTYGTGNTVLSLQGKKGRGRRTKNLLWGSGRPELKKHAFRISSAVSG